MTRLRRLTQNKLKIFLVNYLYYDPGKFDTGVIGEINANGLVCKDGVNECFGDSFCSVRIDIKMKILTLSFQAHRPSLPKYLWVI